VGYDGRVHDRLSLHTWMRDQCCSSLTRTAGVRVRVRGSARTARVACENAFWPRAENPKTAPLLCWVVGAMAGTSLRHI
jgi:hypothetical protein